MSLKKMAKHFRFASCLMLAAVSAPGIAAPPFDVRGPDFPSPAQIVDSVSNTCADYNARVSTLGVSPPGGSSAPGTCGFSTLQILMGGQPAAQYLALVASGANPPPFRTVFKPPSQSGLCAVASNVRVELGASVQPNVSSWPKSGAIGGACGAESGRHPFIDYGAIDAHAFSALRAMGHFLDVAVSGPNTVKVCVKEKQTAQAEMLATQKLAVAFANKVQAALNSNPIRLIGKQWSESAGIATNCLLRCNQCGSGWAGTITNNEQVIDIGGGNFIHNELDTYYVGGPQTANGNVTMVPADWTATGGGTNLMGGKEWTLNAAASGNCPGSNQQVCVLITSDAATGIRSFTEQNVQLIINGGYTLTQGSLVIHPPVFENQFNPPVKIQGRVTDNFAVNQMVYVPASPNDCALPELHSGTLKCTQTWDWKLYLQQ